MNYVNPAQRRANREKWIEALRSGSYSQGDGRLRYQDQFCCLGVACDLAAKDGVGKWVGPDDEWRFDSTTAGDYSNQAMYLTNEVMDWLGLATNDGNFEVEGNGPSSLVGLNDNGTSFATIADIIEAEPEGLIR